MRRFAALRALIRNEKGIAMRFMRATLITLGVVQILFGAMLLATPATLPALFHLRPAAPDWVNWVLAMSAARFIGYGIGMFVAARAPWRNRGWIDTMIAIQVVDFLATAGYLAAGVLSVRRVAPAVVPPLLWIAVLGWARLRARTAATPISPPEPLSPARRV
jgi:hypothetical protein